MSLGEVVHDLDEETLRVFAEKGIPFGEVRQVGHTDAVKVRRIMQLTRDLTAKDFTDLHVLDLACAEGLYSIEAGLRGADVVAIDGRTERMDKGRAIVQRLGLDRVRFEQGDIRRVTPATHGTFDVVYFLGILYHLDAPEVFGVLANLRDLARGLVVIDTHIALCPDAQAEHRGHRYAGWRYREHGEADPEAARRGRVGASLDNAFSFWFAKGDLIRLLVDIGFTAVLEAHAPLEPGKSADRITLVATRGTPVAVSAYTWINGLTEDAIAALVSPRRDEPAEVPSPHKQLGFRSLVNGMLRRTLGVELRRV
jgi:SAM-dependent methyltransferase